MPNNVNSCKKFNENAQTAKFTVFAREISSEVQKPGKLGKLKRKLLKIFKYYTISRWAPLESWRPEDSEKMVLFGCTTLLKQGTSCFCMLHGDEWQILKRKKTFIWMGWGKKGKGWTLDLCAINYRILVFKFEMCNFLFGTQTLIYQRTTKGVVGGGLGWSSLLISQYYFWNLFYIMYDISVSYFWFFRNKFLEYYKLYFCRKKRAKGESETAR